MAATKFRLLFFAFAGLCSMSNLVSAQENLYDRHIKVVLRMIGHKILLSDGDMTSRILPVEKQGDSYRLNFESEFQFDPGKLIVLIDRVVQETEMAVSYIVEVENVETKEIVYSYEVGNSTSSDLLPCLGRAYPRAHYNLLFTILSFGDSAQANSSTNFFDREKSVRIFTMVLFLIIVLIIYAFYVYFKKNGKTKPQPNSNTLSIGEYTFDKRNMTLSFKEELIDLSGKESDLLLLLHSSANNTVERDVILNTVWGDQGDYVGRTLDVFISKLRKKLEADSNLKIVNIRGVGYKLILNG